MDDGGRRHPRWGIAAQVTAIVGAVGMVLTIGLLWVAYSSTTGTVDGLMGDLDAVIVEAQGKYEAAVSALDEQAGSAISPDAQALFEASGLSAQACVSVSSGVRRRATGGPPMPWWSGDRAAARSMALGYDATTVASRYRSSSSTAA